MPLPFHTLDVFTNTRFAGNPVAVVREAGALTDRQMQRIAREFNLSETVFVQPPDDPENTARVRIFMPVGELPFAGHPTIGTAVLLASLDAENTGDVACQIRLEEQVGLVPVDITRSDGVWHGVLSAATMPSPAGSAPANDILASSIGLPEGAIGYGSHRPGLFDAGVRYLYIPVRDLEALARAHVVDPDWTSMTAACGVDSAYIYTASGTDLRARLFSPQSGIPEDPATGSAAAAMPGQLNAAGALPDGQHHWHISQGYEMGRPSEIDLSAQVENGEITRVQVGGDVVMVSTGYVAD